MVQHCSAPINAISRYEQPIISLSHSKLKREGGETRHAGVEEPSSVSFVVTASI
jgi:hypothetical protein